MKTTEIIKPLDKGQITIPASFRKELGIGKDTLLEVSVQEGDLIVRPLKNIPSKYLRKFSKEDVQEFLTADKL